MESSLKDSSDDFDAARQLSGSMELSGYRMDCGPCPNEGYHELDSRWIQIRPLTLTAQDI